MNVTDRVCNLECVKEGNVHEFVGPVKIVLVDPPEDQYKRRKAGGATATLANFMMGANTMCIVLFCFGYHAKYFMNTHILCCTIGYQLCMPFGILMLNPLFGAASPMKKTHRRIEHFFLQLLGMSLYVTGTVFSIVLGEDSIIDPPAKYTSPHFFSGMFAAVLAAMCFLTGPFLLLYKEEQIAPTCITTAHRLSGIATFSVSSICFLTGIRKNVMSIFFFMVGYMVPLGVVVLFCLFYTWYVIKLPISNYRRSK